MPNIKSGFAKTTPGAKSAAKSEVFPKVVFKWDDPSSTKIIRSASDYASIPDDDYYLAEPVQTGWGEQFDILRGRTNKGSYVIVYEQSPVVTPPVGSCGCPNPTIEFQPFVTNTGSNLDYSWKYNGTLNPNTTYYYRPVSSKTKGTQESGFVPFWWYSGPVPIADESALVGGGYGAYSLDPVDGSMNWYVDQPVLTSTGGTGSLNGYLPIIRENDMIYPLSSVYQEPLDNTLIAFVKVDKATGAVTPLKVPYSALVEGYLNYGYNDELILKPDGNSFYLLADEEYVISFTLQPDGVTLSCDGLVTGFLEEGEGMTSAHMFKRVPGENALYYVSYSRTAKIDCTTNTAVWMVDVASDDDICAVNSVTGNLIRPIKAGVTPPGGGGGAAT